MQLIEKTEKAALDAFLQTDKAMAKTGQEIVKLTQSGKGLSKAFDTSIWKDLSFSIGGVALKFGSLGDIISDVIAIAVKLGNQMISLAATEETSFVSLEAAINSMGLSSRTSAEYVRLLAESMTSATNVDHVSLEQAAAIFMRIGSIDPSNLYGLLKVTADYATGTGQGMAEAAQNVASALETGQTSALGFSQAIGDQVNEMVSAGNTAGALSLTAKTLNDQYGGQAAAQLDTYTGSTKALKIAWEDLLAIWGKDLAEPITEFNTTIAQDLTKMVESAREQQIMEDAVKYAEQKVPSMKDLNTLSVQGSSIVPRQFVPSQAEVDAYQAAKAEYIATQVEFLKAAEMTLRGTKQAEASGLTVRRTMEDLKAAGSNMRAVAGQVDMFGVAVTDAADASKQLQGEFNFVLNYGQSYRKNQQDIKTATENLSQAEQDLADLQKTGWRETSDKVQEAKGKVDEMRTALDNVKQASVDASNEMIAGFLQSQLSLDGTFSEDDMKRVLDFRRTVGLLSDDEYDASLQAMNIAQAFADIPEESEKTFSLMYQLSGDVDLAKQIATGITNGDVFPGIGPNGKPLPSGNSIASVPIPIKVDITQAIEDIKAGKQQMDLQAATLGSVDFRTTMDASQLDDTEGTAKDLRNVLLDVDGKTYKVTIDINTTGGNGYLVQGEGGTWQWIPAEATGTNYVSGLFVAGEGGGGAEYIYAPGGATVFNPKQTRAMQSEMERMRPTEQHNYLYGPATLVIMNEESVESLLSVR